MRDKSTEQTFREFAKTRTFLTIAALGVAVGIGMGFAAPLSLWLKVLFGIGSAVGYAFILLAAKAAVDDIR